MRKQLPVPAACAEVFQLWMVSPPALTVRTESAALADIKAQVVSAPRRDYKARVVIATRNCPTMAGAYVSRQCARTLKLIHSRLEFAPRIGAVMVESPRITVRMQSPPLQVCWLMRAFFVPAAPDADPRELESWQAWRRFPTPELLAATKPPDMKAPGEEGAGRGLAGLPETPLAKRAIVARRVKELADPHLRFPEVP